ncbi:MAG: hypothetical protein AAF569_05765 [Pseudomonadota bacterium]
MFRTSSVIARVALLSAFTAIATPASAQDSSPPIYPMQTLDPVTCGALQNAYLATLSANAETRHILMLQRSTELVLQIGQLEYLNARECFSSDEYATRHNQLTRELQIHIQAYADSEGLRTVNQFADGQFGPLTRYDYFLAFTYAQIRTQNLDKALGMTGLNRDFASSFSSMIQDINPETFQPDIETAREEAIRTIQCRGLHRIENEGRTTLLTNGVGQTEWQARLDGMALQIGHLIEQVRLKCDSASSLVSEFGALTREMQELHAEYEAEHGLEILSPVDGIWGPLTSQDFFTVSQAAGYYAPFVYDTGRHAEQVNNFFNAFVGVLTNHIDTETLSDAIEKAREAAKNPVILGICTGQPAGYRGPCPERTVFKRSGPSI